MYITRAMHSSNGMNKIMCIKSWNCFWILKSVVRALCRSGLNQLQTIISRQMMTIMDSTIANIITRCWKENWSKGNTKKFPRNELLRLLYVFIADTDVQILQTEQQYSL